jgi:DNA (cytosine-5)-methyltransferase 1
VIRIGELCAGYGGISMGLDLALGGATELAFVADNDKGASKILAHRYPGVPNLGDITEVNWGSVQPVDILAAGFPSRTCRRPGCGAGSAGEPGPGYGRTSRRPSTRSARPP